MASAVLSGTLIPSITETDLQAWTEDQTIIITVTDCVWDAAGPSFDSHRTNILLGLVGDEGGATNFLAEIATNANIEDVIRTSDTVVTITFKAADAEEYGSFDITTTETVTVTIPKDALDLAEDLVASNTFQITVGAAVVVDGYLPSRTYLPSHPKDPKETQKRNARQRYRATH